MISVIFKCDVSDPRDLVRKALFSRERVSAVRLWGEIIGDSKCLACKRIYRQIVGFNWLVTVPKLSVTHNKRQCLKPALSVTLGGWVRKVLFWGTKGAANCIIRDSRCMSLSRQSKVIERSCQPEIQSDFFVPQLSDDPHAEFGDQSVQNNKRILSLYTGNFKVSLCWSFRARNASAA